MMARKRTLIVLLGTLGLLLLGSAFAWACTDRASIQLDPRNGPAGGQITVRGGSFIEGEVDVYWDSVTPANHLATVEATDPQGDGSDSGSFSTQVTIPQAREGSSHTIVARSSADDNGAHYTASKSFNVTASMDEGSDESTSGGDGSQETSGGETSQTSGSGSSQSPENEATSQESSGVTSQETSAADGREQERTRGGSSESSSVPGLGSGQEDSADTVEEGSQEPATAEEGSQEPAQAEEPAQERQHVGPDEQAAPAPSTSQQPEQPENTPASANTGAVENDSGETVFGGSVGASDSNQQAQQPAPAAEEQPSTAEQPSPADEGPEAVAAEPNQSSGFSVPEAMRGTPEQGAMQPSETSAGNDLWSGLESGDTPTLSGEDAVAGSESPTDGFTGALTLGASLLGLGLVTLFAGLGTMAVRRRRQPAATIASHSRGQRD